jgi:TetR/AcrR family transcriptional repressor of mexJK operon
MPRVAGQVDLIKSEAMLDAASQVIAERGLTAPVEAIAKRAGVSKQTLYNRYGGKAGLIRALIRRRIDTVTAPLADAAGDVSPEATLAAFARGLMTAMLTPAGVAMTRVAIQSAVDMPDISAAVYDAGAGASRARLAEFLRLESAAGRLEVDDPAEAADLFSGMVGARQLRALLGAPTPSDAESIEALSQTIARRFVRAYAPAG